MLRKFVGFKLGKLKIVNKVVLDLNGKKTWVFHGDVFDITMQYSKWLAKLGSIGYDFLILLNTMINWILVRLKRDKLSLSKKIKNSVKSAVKYINSFENVAAEIAVSNGYDYVVCGHIHQPEQREIVTSEGSVNYLNSGDWIENCSALEYQNGQWNLYFYNEDALASSIELTMIKEDYLNNEILFHQLVTEFKLKQA
jgi:UDP-2,3-diacylglucosamine pyrophosphatase LpxH